MLKSLCSSSLLVLIMAAPAAAQPQVPSAPAVIVTTGEAVVKRAPDRAWVMIGAESRAKAAAEAQRLNTDVMTAVIDRIKAAAIPADAIQTTGYTLQPEFDYANGKQTLRGYVARNQVQVRIDALPRTGDVISAVVTTGATTITGVRFDLKDRDSVERQALSLAVRDARRRADAAASGAGVQIDRVIRIEEERETGDIIRPMQRNMASMTESVTVQAAVPVEAGEIEVRSRVTLTASIR